MPGQSWKVLSGKKSIIFKNASIYKKKFKPGI